MKHFILIISVLGILLSEGCSPRAHFRCLKWRTFLSEPIQTARQQFPGFDLEKQFAIHACGIHDSEPPRIGFYSPMIARRGAAAIPFLQSKLLEINGTDEVYDVVEVFWLMQMQGSYNVVADPNLIKLLDENIAKMGNGLWKDSAVQAMGHITTSPQKTRP